MSSLRRMLEGFTVDHPRRWIVGMVLLLAVLLAFGQASVIWPYVALLVLLVGVLWMDRASTDRAWRKRAENEPPA